MSFVTSQSFFVLPVFSRLWVVIMSLEALRPRTTVESAMEMARPAGLCGDTTNPSILREKVKNCYSFFNFY